VKDRYGFVFGGGFGRVRVVTGGLPPVLRFCTGFCLFEPRVERTLGGVRGLDEPIGFLPARRMIFGLTFGFVVGTVLRDLDVTIFCAAMVNKYLPTSAPSRLLSRDP
jgi:hypothetical protein